MVQGIRGYRLLQGYRGHPPADIAAIEEVLLRVSRLVEDIPEIRELVRRQRKTLPNWKGIGSKNDSACQIGISAYAS